MHLNPLQAVELQQWHTCETRRIPQKILQMKLYYAKLRRNNILLGGTRNNQVHHQSNIAKHLQNDQVSLPMFL